MITRLSLVTILVRDQEEALRWFTEILGLKKLQDASYGTGSRWLVVAPSRPERLWYRSSEAGTRGTRCRTSAHEDGTNRQGNDMGISHR